MEEWIGRQWHRLLTHPRLQSGPGHHPQAAAALAPLRHTLGLLLRAGGGAPAQRLAPAAPQAWHGPRHWLQRLAGPQRQALQGRWHPEVLSLPPEIALFPDPALNRALYLWLAALGAQLRPQPDWLAAHQAATQRALAIYPGLQPAYQRLLAAQLASRPDPARLDARAAQAERWLQQVLRGGPLPDGGLAPRPDEVAPLWLWLGLDPAGGTAAGLPRSEALPAPGHSGSTAEDPQRRAAEAVADRRHAAPLVMFFRAESLLSWGEFTHVNRADDDDEDPQARQVANDLDRLAIAPDGRRAASRLRFDLDLPSAAQDDLPLGPGERLPEWDWRSARLLPAHCAVQCRIARPAANGHNEGTIPPALRVLARQVRRRLEALRAAPLRRHGHLEGDEIDLDAWVRHASQPRLDSAAREAPAVFLRQERGGRSLATLLLADLSLSTDAYATPQARVIDVIRDALLVFGEALGAAGDTFAMLGFSSVRRHEVRIQHLKGFDQRWDGAAVARVQALRPLYYTRMGAAIRHATTRLAARGERQRLLLLLTDGKPNDLDHYEGRHGMEDTRHAVLAARRAGLLPFAITIDATAHHYLPQLFGQQGYVQLHRPQELVTRLAAVYAALSR